ncbi:MAG TPA: phosphate regulon sensor histidine kinase PhoR [Candidatus Methylomirabilis sp.]|nr:phosphate regulon sensor histidine kinase PhoR [Candidatus Methylomirabilis sp.]
MHPGLWREVWILAGIAAASLLFGALTGRPFLIAAFGFGLYIVINLRHLRQLHRWLQNRQSGEIPDAGGLWGDVFDELYRIAKETGRREAQLSEMLTRFQSAASAMPDAVAIVSRESEIEWANPAASRLLGIRYPQDAGMRLLNLLRDPEFAQYLQSGEYSEPIEIESPETHEMHISVQITPFGSLQQLVIGRDVTRLARLEQMRRNFVANVSHELRTPLTVLGGYIETLRQIDKIRPEELRKHLTIMHEQSARMQRLVDDLLTLSRLETSPPRTQDETVDVAALLTGLKEQAELLSGENRHVITLEADPGLKLLGSREELTSAFQNLLINAVRYTPAAGAIRLTWRARDGGAEFVVADTGEGIAPEHIPHLTERFYRVDTARSRASGGTGLGLSIVKHVLLRHDAHLEVESELGRGSTFTCVFPSARTQRAEASRSAHNAA